MVLNRNVFFLALFILFLGPTMIHKIFWLSTSIKTTGRMWFLGHTLEVQGGVSSHPVILFYAGKDSFYFNAPGYLRYQTDDQVPVRYQRNNPADALVVHPRVLWFDSLKYVFLPLLVLLVLFLTPERFDPLIPRRAKIRIGLKPVIKIIPAT